MSLTLTDAAASSSLPETDLVEGVTALHTALDGLTASRSTDAAISDERLRAVSAALARAKARIDAVLMVIARDLSERDAARAAGVVSTGQLLATDFGGDRADTSRLVTTARQITNTPMIEEALASGSINRDQAAIITRAMNNLPAAVPQVERQEAQRSLLTIAGEASIQDLGRAATRAAEAFKTRAQADAHEEDQLQARERRARRSSSFWMRDNRDGTWRGYFTVPDLEAESLRTAVEALAAPRRYHLDESADHIDEAEPDWWPMDKRHRDGRAFAAVCTHLPTDALPNAGGISSLLTVNVDYETTRAAVARLAAEAQTAPSTDTDSGESAISTEGQDPGGPDGSTGTGHAPGFLVGLGHGTLPSGTRISAAQVRLLACSAGVLPQVLGGASLPLDLGTTQRLFNATQRRALAVRDRGCCYPGCDRPPAWCEGHHWRDAWKPRRLGGPHGPTDIANGCLLCAYHHRLVHERDIEIRERDGHLEFLVPPQHLQGTRTAYGGDLFAPDNPPGELQWQRNYHWAAA